MSLREYGSLVPFIGVGLHLKGYPPLPWIENLLGDSARVVWRPKVELEVSFDHKTFQPLSAKGVSGRWRMPSQEEFQEVRNG